MWSLSVSYRALKQLFLFYLIYSTEENPSKVISTGIAFPYSLAAPSIKVNRRAFKEF
jgi:hypothetical protein